MIATIINKHMHLMQAGHSPEELSLHDLKDMIADAVELEGKAAAVLEHFALMNDTIRAHARVHPMDTVQSDPLQPAYDVIRQQLESIHSGKGRRWRASLVRELGARQRQSGNVEDAMDLIEDAAPHMLAAEDALWLRELADNGHSRAAQLLSDFSFQCCPPVKLPPVTYSRGMAYGGNNTLFISDRTGGNLFAVNIEDGHHLLVREGLNCPNGLRVHDDTLYACETNAGKIHLLDVANLSSKAEFDLASLLKKTGQDSGQLYKPYQCLQYKGKLYVIVVDDGTSLMQSALVSFDEDNPAATLEYMPLPDLRLTDLVELEGRLTGVNLTPGLLVTLNPETGSWHDCYDSSQGDIFYAATTLGGTVFLTGKHRLMRLDPTGHMLMQRHTDDISGHQDTYPVSCALADHGDTLALYLLDNQLRLVHCFNVEVSS